MVLRLASSSPLAGSVTAGRPGFLIVQEGSHQERIPGGRPLVRGVAACQWRWFLGQQCLVYPAGSRAGGHSSLLGAGQPPSQALVACIWQERSLHLPTYPVLPVPSPDLSRPPPASTPAASNLSLLSRSLCVPLLPCFSAILQSVPSVLPSSYPPRPTFVFPMIVLKGKGSTREFDRIQLNSCR